MAEPASPTPMMAQWHACKAQAKDALLFFRLGDFYEAFHEDAQVISKEINVTLTSRGGVPMCGVPFHASEQYVDRLIAKGHKVAIAEQTEDPKQTKGLIRREITRVITPGTIVSSQLLSDKKHNYFVAIVQVCGVFGLSYIDLTTGTFHTLEIQEEGLLLDEIDRLRPAEFLVEQTFLDTRPRFFEELSYLFPFRLNTKEQIDAEMAAEALSLHFGQPHLTASGLCAQGAAATAAGMLLLHLKKDLLLGLEQITAIQTESRQHTMAIDRSTLRNLDLSDSLFDFLDETATPMGARLLGEWLKAPLLSCAEIEKRQNAVASFLSFSERSEQAGSILSKIRDLERIAMKVAARMGGPRDLYALGHSLSHLPELKDALAHFAVPEPGELFDASPVFQKILSAMNDSPPLRIGEGEIFKDGFHPELDRLRTLSKDSMSWMALYQTRLREETGIKTLKVGYTRAFGYYIEASRVQSEKIPSFFHRRQTLVNGERFVTEELKQFEHQVLASEERAKALEAECFEALRADTAQHASSIQRAAQIIARIDVLLSLAKVAKRSRFVRPIVDSSTILHIKEGRHPIVERSIGNASFIANDTDLSPQKQLMLITGPNMAGKSTYIRQVALIAILAQMGSYVPAASARIGLIDKVFSRIGASDDLARGQSTFMVEMSETANILHNATPRSLVILDEIGRGTSTYDGISIAWAVAEFLLTAPGHQAKTLFATHYWELTRLEAELPHAVNYQTAIQEVPAGIVFLRKIIKGGTDKSYGIHVAKLAGLPPKAIRRAEEMLLQLETNASRKKRKPSEQLPLFLPASEHPAISELKKIDLHQITPMQALQKLIEWQNKF